MLCKLVEIVVSQNIGVNEQLTAGLSLMRFLYAIITPIRFWKQSKNTDYLF